MAPAKRSRRTERVPVVVRARARGAFNGAVELNDVSVNGAFIVGPPSTATRQVELSFTLPGESAALEVVAEVKRATKTGTGIRFVRLTADTLAALKRFVERASDAQI